MGAMTRSEGSGYGGIVYSNQDYYPKALEFYTKAMNIWEKVLGKEYPDTKQAKELIEKIENNTNK